MSNDEQAEWGHYVIAAKRVQQQKQRQQWKQISSSFSLSLWLWRNGVLCPLLQSTPEKTDQHRNKQAKDRLYRKSLSLFQLPPPPPQYSYVLLIMPITGLITSPPLSHSGPHSAHIAQCAHSAHYSALATAPPRGRAEEKCKDGSLELNWLAKLPLSTAATDCDD